jgi:hypothetical protein
VSAALRTAVAVALALPAAALGGGAAAAAHYLLVQPSDAELIAVATEVVPDGFATLEPPFVDGTWAPAFFRGRVAAHAQAGTAPDADALVASLTDAGWEPTEVERIDTGGTDVLARRGGVVLAVSLEPRPAVLGTDLGLSVWRGEQTPSYPVLVGVGVAVGAAGGAVAGARLGGRLRTRRQREYVAWRRRRYGEA